MTADVDGDGIPNRLDLDSDNDGINDVIEAGGTDADKNGQADGTPSATGIPATAGTGDTLVGDDADSDTRPNPYDLDSDNDGINDLKESGNPALVDANGDGIVDGTDTDKDGIVGAADTTPTAFGDSTDPSPVNTDGLTTPDYLDLDSDNDGLTDLAESGIANVPTLDANGDGKIDNPADADGDGIPQVVDGAPTVFGDANNPTLPDTDTDGNPDYTDPTDTDGDGVPDLTDLDDDNDGILDTTEDATSCTTASGVTSLNSDCDGDGIPNRLDLDSDNDGINDVTEGGGTDTDGNGIADGTVSATGIPATAGTGLTPPNTDGTGGADPYDLDSDNDGTTDLVESGQPVSLDANGDGRVDDINDPDKDGIMTSVDGLPTVRGDLPPQVVKISCKALLQGAYNNAAGLMRDDLRVKGLLPLTQPYGQTIYADNLYTGTETTTSAVLAVTGANAIVDWVIVEMRDKNNPATILAKRAGLVQRDGDIVDVDGVNPLVFTSLVPESYYVAVKHRNHLGVMTNTAIPLSSAGTVVDFTSTTQGNFKVAGVLGSNFAQKVSANGKRLLWASNVQKENNVWRVIYQGPNNEVSPVYIDVLTAANNPNFNANYILSGYLRSDVTMDGRTIYQGPNNEVDIIYFEVITHPENTSLLANFIINQQIP